MHFCWGKLGAGLELGIAVNYSYYADLAQIESGDCTDKGAAWISAHML